MATYRKEAATPMLATLVKEPFDDPDWLFEVKFDGYRAISFLDGKNVNIYSRNQNLFNRFYPTLVTALEKMNLDAVFDGEIVALDQKGISNFELLKNYQSDHKGKLCYYVFDLLFLNGKDLRDLPLIERKKLLKKILPKSSLIRYSDHVEGQGVALFREMEKRRMEGVIAKRKDSPYVTKRSKDWLKFKVSLQQDAIIIGFTEPKGSRKYFGSLLLAIREGRTLRNIGQVGTGFDQATLQALYKKLKPLIKSKSGNVTLVEPKLHCEVAFTEWTKDGKMRHPVYVRGPE